MTTYTHEQYFDALVLVEECLPHTNRMFTDWGGLINPMRERFMRESASWIDQAFLADDPAAFVAQTEEELLRGYTLGLVCALKDHGWEPGYSNDSDGIADYTPAERDAIRAKSAAFAPYLTAMAVLFSGHRR